MTRPVMRRKVMVELTVENTPPFPELYDEGTVLWGEHQRLRVPCRLNGFV
jgi:hypothetical protein